MRSPLHYSNAIIRTKVRQLAEMMTDRDATFKATAGLLNRQKIRDKLSKLYGKGGDWEGEAKPLDNYDDLLHKDHKRNPGSFMNEWCHLAGIKEERKKAKKRGR